MKKVSIVVTVKNEEQAIKALLDSLEIQTFVPEEIIIVDGGSTDRTIEIIEKRMEKNKMIKLVVARGSVIARGRNVGVSNSVGEIIAMTDAGCIINKNWLLNIVEPLLAKPKIGIVAGSYEMTGKSLFQEAIKPYLGTTYKLIVSSNFFPSTRSIAFKKSVWKKIDGFSEDLELAGEDTLFNYQAIKKEIQFRLARTAIVKWEVPKSLKEFFKKIFCYAKGDAQTGIWWHPEKKLMTHNIKITMIYLRYLVGLSLFFLSLTQLFFFKILVFLFFLYFVWIVLKNYHQLERKFAIILSPFIQLISDIAVMLGFASGVLSKL